MLKRLITTLLAIATIAALLGVATPAGAVGGGFFSVKCRLSHRAEDDPIVFPGLHGRAHLHDFFANRSTDANSTRRSMLRARTSCALSGDRSGYWTPALRDPNGRPAGVLKIIVYYRSKEGMRVRPFPANLKIITGGDTTRPPAPSRSQSSLSWACGDSPPYTPAPPDCSGTGQTVTAHIHFPDCWDGERKDSSDHRSHMTWGDPECPRGYVAVPRLRFHIAYDVVDGTRYDLSSDGSGDADGQTLHADFWNTWRQRTLRFLVGHCLNGGRSCSHMTDRKLAGMRR